MEKEIIYPVRINKYLAFKNIASRREADALISNGKVKINGRVAKLGDKVLQTDEVTLSQKGQMKKLEYYAYNKPKGIVTVGPQGDEKSIEHVTNFSRKIYPIGRLDKNSWGLIILTNDGRVTDRILNPDFHHEKEYKVKVDRSITPAFINQMENGVELDDGYVTRPCQVKKIDPHTFSVILTEGKRRQIKRMCERLERTVTDLLRTRIINIKLGNLKPGQSRRISGRELEEFMSSIGLE